MRETRLDSVIALRSGGLTAPISAWVAARVAEMIAAQPRIVSAPDVRVREDGQVRLMNDRLPAPFSSRAPEILQGGEEDARAAVFALGVLVVELALGRPPFQRASDLETRLAIADEPVPHLEGRAARASKLLDRLIARAAAKDPSDRFDSPLAFRDAIEAYLADELHDVGEKQLARTVRDAIEQAPSTDRSSMPDYAAAEIDLAPQKKRSSHPDKPKFDQELVRIGDPHTLEASSSNALGSVRPGARAAEPELDLQVDDAAILAARKRRSVRAPPPAAPARQPMGWMGRLALSLFGVLALSIAYQFLLRPLLFR